MTEFEAIWPVERNIGYEALCAEANRDLRDMLLDHHLQPVGPAICRFRLARDVPEFELDPPATGTVFAGRVKVEPLPTPAVAS